MKRRIAVISVLLVFMAVPSFAQLGSGIVFDPTNYKNAVLRYLQLQQQLRQLEQAYSLSMQQYQFLQAQARQIQNMPQRYQAQFAQWSNLSANDVLGNNTQWVSGINSGNFGTAKLGYGQLNASLGTPAGVNSYDSLKQAYGLEEVSDGSTVNSMATIGQMRANAQQLQLHIKQLQDDSLSSAPDMNTQIAVLNKINAASVLLVETMQDTNKLLASLLEQQLLTTERTRTSTVGSINAELYRQQNFSDVMSFTNATPTQLKTPGGN